MLNVLINGYVVMKAILHQFRTVLLHESSFAGCHLFRDIMYISRIKTFFAKKLGEAFFVQDIVDGTFMCRIFTG